MHRGVAVVVLLCCTVLCGANWSRCHSECSNTPILDSLPIRVALYQQNLHTLSALVDQVSDPTSHAYGKHLTSADIARIISPNAESISAAKQWLQQCASTAVEVTGTGDYLLATVNVKCAEQLFAVQFASYRHSGTGRVIRRSTAPVTIPAHLASIVESVSGVSDFPVVPTRLETGDYPGDNITPPVIKKLYSVTASGTNSSNKQAVAEFEQEYFYPSDLEIFEQMYDLPAQPVAGIIGKNKPDSGVLGEASLDVQYIIGVGTNIPTWVWSLDQFDLVAWAINVTSYPDAPRVHSISFGSGEQAFDEPTMTRTNTEFMKMAAMGFSVLVASGDSGTGSTGIITCGKFSPTFPASSPYVTAVGATYLTDNHETAVSFSGGGFSDTFARPPYQNDAVENYLNILKQKGIAPEDRYWNSSGRGFPDVSAVGTNFLVTIQNATGPISGTSAATPTFAAIIALINDARAQNGKPALGFLNPLLYQLRSVGTDITEGNNKAHFCPAGFTAEEGWDAISGWGTPNFPQLLKALLNV